MLTVKPVLNVLSPKDGKLIFKTNYHLTQVKSIAEFCDTFDLHLAVTCQKEVFFVYFWVAVSHRFYCTHHIIWAMTWDFQQCGMCNQQRLRPACAYAQSDQSLCLSLEYSLTVKLLTEHHLEFLSLKGGCTGSSESTHVKMPHCWKSHVTPFV